MPTINNYNQKINNIAIYGLGNFGYAFLKHFDKKPENFALTGFDRDKELIAHLKKHRRHLFLHQEYMVSTGVSFAQNEQALLSGCDCLILAVPSSATREVIRKLRPHLRVGIIIVNTAKALDNRTGQRLSQVIKRELKGRKYHYALFAGGTIAADLFKHEPLGATLACENRKLLLKLKKTFQSSNLKVYPSPDLIGVEYAAAFKNVISILAGIIKGMGFSYGSETHIISTVAGDIENIVTRRLGGSTKTFQLGSQAWGNDLWMSCTGPTRNREFGILLGQGRSVDSAIRIMKKRNKTVEGINTIRILDSIVPLDNYPYLSFLHSFIIKKTVTLGAIRKIIFN